MDWGLVWISIVLPRKNKWGNKRSAIPICYNSSSDEGPVGSVVLEKTLTSPLGCKEIQPVNPIGNQSWIFIGRTDVEAEAPIVWPPDAKSWLLGKNPDAWKDWRWEKKVMTEDEMVGWHHRLNGLEFVQAPGVGDEQGRLVCCCLSLSQRVRHDWTTELDWRNTRKAKVVGVQGEGLGNDGRWSQRKDNTRSQAASETRNPWQQVKEKPKSPRPAYTWVQKDLWVK